MIKASFFPPLSLLARFSLLGWKQWKGPIDGHVLIWTHVATCAFHVVRYVAVGREGVSSSTYWKFLDPAS